MNAYLQAGLDALADRTRMAIFQQLSEGPIAVHELARKLPVTRPAVSQHLRVLKDAGLVIDAKEGTRRYSETGVDISESTTAKSTRPTGSGGLPAHLPGHSYSGFARLPAES